MPDRTKAVVGRDRVHVRTWTNQTNSEAIYLQAGNWGQGARHLIYHCLALQNIIIANYCSPLYSFLFYILWFVLPYHWLTGFPFPCPGPTTVRPHSNYGRQAQAHDLLVRPAHFSVETSIGMAVEAKSENTVRILRLMALWSGHPFKLTLNLVIKGDNSIQGGHL